MKQFLKRNWKKILIILILLVLIVAVASAGGRGDEGISKYTVDRGLVADTLVLSGEVEPVQEVEMAFPISGLVERIYKDVGEPVFPREKIIELDNRSLRADLADAVAALALQKAESQVSNAELDIAVENAYTRLLSDDLAAYSRNMDDNSSAPEVSGSYTGNIEGEYRIVVETSNSASGYDFRYSGIETGKQEIVFYKAVSLGTYGLQLKFEEGETFSGDTWRIAIPNVEGDSYVENLNNYKSALASRDAAETGNISRDISNAKIKQAEAQVAKINAEIAERTLTAPFGGVVGNIDIKEGEIAEGGKIVAKILSEGAYNVIVEIPEIDVVKMEEGLPAEIRLDAYGEETVFEGLVLSIDPAETEVDGVSVYEARIGFNKPDDRVRSGMTSDVMITREKKEEVLRIPERFIYEDETGKYVKIEVGEDMTKVNITIGLVGTDGFVEVIDGLKEGDVVVERVEE